MSFPSWNPISITLRSLFMNVSGGLFCLLGFKTIWLIKVILSSQATLSLRSVCATTWTHQVGPAAASFSTSCGSSAIRVVCVVEIVEVIKHEIHIFGLLTLKMVNDPLVFVHFYSNVSISLSRYSPWLDEVTRSQGIWILLIIICIHIVTTLGCWNITLMMISLPVLVIVLQFLATPNRLIVEVFRLLLKLVIRHVEGIAPHRIVPISHLVQRLVSILLVVVSCSSILTFNKSSLIKALHGVLGIFCIIFEFIQTVLSLRTATSYPRQGLSLAKSSINSVVSVGGMSYSLTSTDLLGDSSILIIVNLLGIMVKTRGSWHHLMSQLMVLLILKSVRTFVVLFIQRLPRIDGTRLVSLLRLRQIGIRNIKIVRRRCKFLYIILS